MTIPKDARIFIAGHRGLVGSAILRQHVVGSYSSLILRTRQELDLLDAQSVDRFFDRERPEYVYLAAAKVGGILANSTYPADFIRENLGVQTNVIDAAHKYGTKKLLFLGSSCIYPKHAPQPIKEEYLLSGALEPTNEPYAIAKIAGIVTCQSYNKQFGTRFISVMPTNLYGPGDNFDLQSSHVLPALIRKFHDAKVRGDETVTVWGTGNVRREFLHVDDMARACVLLMNVYDGSPIINIGCGEDVSIRELAELVARVVGFDGDLAFDTSKPDGTPRKLLDISRLREFGWRPEIPLREGIASTYSWYLAQLADSPAGSAKLSEARSDLARR